MNLQLSRSRGLGWIPLGIAEAERRDERGSPFLVFHIQHLGNSHRARKANALI